MPDREKRAGCTFVLFLICIAVTIGVVLPVGYSLGSVNTPAEFVIDWVDDTIYEEFEVELDDSVLYIFWGGIVAMVPVGGIFGSFLVRSYSKRFGRKGTLVASGIFLAAASGFQVACRETDSVVVIFLSRLLIGISAAFAFAVQPMYLLEIVPLHLRGLAGIFTGIGVSGGIVMGQVFSLKEIFGTEELWPYALGFFGVFVLVSLIPFIWFPESPRMLLLVQRDEEQAKAALKKLRGHKATEIDIEGEIADIKRIATATDTEDMTMLTVIRRFEYRLPLVLICSFMLCQQLSGINAIFFYSVRIFEKTGFSRETATWMTLGSGVLNFGCTFLCSILIGFLNRRPLMLISTGGCAVSLTVLAFSLKYIKLMSFLPHLFMAFFALFFVFFGMGLGSIPFFIGVELFEVAPRPVAMSMGNLFFWIGNFLVSFCYPFLVKLIGAFCFLPCAASCLFVFFLTLFFLPETRGRNASEIKHLINNGLRSKVRIREETGTIQTNPSQLTNQ